MLYLANGWPMCRRREGSAGSARGVGAVGTIGLLGISSAAASRKGSDAFMDSLTMYAYRAL